MELSDDYEIGSEEDVPAPAKAQTPTKGQKRGIDKGAVKGPSKGSATEKASATEGKMTLLGKRKRSE